MEVGGEEIGEVAFDGREESGSDEELITVVAAIFCEGGGSWNVMAH